MTRNYQSWVDECRATGAELVQVHRPRPGTAVVVMNDPPRRNALSGPMTVHLRDEIERLVHDPEIRSVVLTGAGGAFSAGGDLRMMRDTAWPLIETEGGTTVLWRWIRQQFGGIARLIAQSDVPFVAAVDGPAAGVGLAFALACDLVLLSRRAVMVTAFARIGLLPEVGMSWALTRRIGYQRAFELFVSGEPLSADEALRLGLANSVHAPEELEAAALAWCDRIAALPDHAVRMAKPLLRGAADQSWQAALVTEELAEPGCFTTAAHREAVTALLRR